jgi:hypothetical protein
VASNFTNDHEIYFSAGFNFPSSNKTINEYRAETGSPPIALRLAQVVAKRVARPLPSNSLERSSRSFCP